MGYRSAPDIAQIVAGVVTAARGRPSLLRVQTDAVDVSEERLRGLSLFKTPTIGGGTHFDVPVASDDGKECCAGPTPSGASRPSRRWHRATVPATQRRAAR